MNKRREKPSHRQALNRSLPGLSMVRQLAVLAALS
jgi:hypothetical protein